MSRTIIRKNASKKITSLLTTAVGIIAKTATPDQADGFDYHYYAAGAVDVLDWLKDAENYQDARVFTDENGSLVVRGQYYFDDQFVAFSNQEKFDQAYQALIAPPRPHQPAPSMDPRQLPVGVVSLCAYRIARSA